MPQIGFLRRSFFRILFAIRSLAYTVPQVGFRFGVRIFLRAAFADSWSTRDSLVT
jgi:hypothetical protein